MTPLFYEVSAWSLLGLLLAFWIWRSIAYFLETRKLRQENEAKMQQRQWSEYMPTLEDEE